MSSSGTAGSPKDGAVIWMTGLSGSGKSTLAEALMQRLAAEKRDSEWLDGDRIRDIVGGLGYTLAERTRHLRYMALTASLLERRGVVTICSFVSPLAEHRKFARSQSNRFIEVYLSTPLEICEARDRKGLYAKARQGELTDLTGIGSPFEIPEAPELKLDASTLKVEEEVEKVLLILKVPRNSSESGSSVAG